MALMALDSLPECEKAQKIQGQSQELVSDKEQQGLDDDGLPVFQSTEALSKKRKKDSSSKSTRPQKKTEADLVVERLTLVHTVLGRFEAFCVSRFGCWLHSSRRACFRSGRKGL